MLWSWWFAVVPERNSVGVPIFLRGTVALYVGSSRDFHPMSLLLGYAAELMDIMPVEVIIAVVVIGARHLRTWQQWQHKAKRTKRKMAEQPQ